MKIGTRSHQMWIEEILPVITPNLLSETLEYHLHRRFADDEIAELMKQVRPILEQHTEEEIFTLDEIVQFFLPFIQKTQP